MASWTRIVTAAVHRIEPIELEEPSRSPTWDVVGTAVKVAVAVGVGVGVLVAVAVGVKVGVGVKVDVGVRVGVAAGRLGTQAANKIKTRI